MAVLVNVSIDVTKIDKSKLIAGKKGTYLNLTVSVNDEKDNYGNDCSAWQSQSQEERQAGESKNYLGNGRKIWEGVQNNQSATANKAATNLADEEEDDLPF